MQAIQGICSRNPLAIDSALLQDLTEYKTKQDKSVMAASRSLLKLYRKINPDMLKRKDRVCIKSLKLLIILKCTYFNLHTELNFSVLIYLINNNREDPVKRAESWLNSVLVEKWFINSYRVVTCFLLAHSCKSKKKKVC